MQRLKETAKRFAFKYTGLGKPSYPYQLEPSQLAEIILALETLTQDLDRPLKSLEVGVARGMTSRLIAEHIQRSGINAEQVCLDTFNSFTDEDLEVEVVERDKDRAAMTAFTYNDYLAWKHNFAEFPFLTAIQGDAGKFDYASVGPIDFCFLDVDLYQPTARALPNIWANLAERAILMVDDTNPDHPLWDGAHQAFQEFVAERGLTYRVIGSKCSMIWKNGLSSDEPMRVLTYHKTSSCPPQA